MMIVYLLLVLNIITVCLLLHISYVVNETVVRPITETRAQLAEIGNVLKLITLRSPVGTAVEGAKTLYTIIKDRVGSAAPSASEI
jgi:hypothetical protein